MDTLEAGTHDVVPVSAVALGEAKSLTHLFQQLVDATPAGTDLQIRKNCDRPGPDPYPDHLRLVQRGAMRHEAAEAYRANIPHHHHRHSSPDAVDTGLIDASVRRVLRPLSKLHQAVLAVANGDLTVRSATLTNDEFGDLSRTFDAMAVDLVTELRHELRMRQR